MKRFLLEVPPKAKEEFYFNIVPSTYSTELTDSAELTEQSAENAEVVQTNVGSDDLDMPSE